VHPHILCKHKLLFWKRLIAINRLTALNIYKTKYALSPKRFNLMSFHIGGKNRHIMGLFITNIQAK